MGVLVWGAIVFHSMSIKDFALLVCSLVVLKACVYLDKKKKASEDLFDYYFTLSLGVVFFSFLVLFLFFKN